MPLRNRTPVLTSTSSSVCTANTGHSSADRDVMHDLEDHTLPCPGEGASVVSDESHRPEEPEPVMFSSFWSSFSFMFAIVFSQHATMGWNIAFAGASIGPLLLALLVTGFAVAIYVFCMVELCILYPFAGGNYAFIRVTFGRFAAFVVGCLDVLQYAFMTSLLVARTSIILRDILNVPTFVAPLFYCAIYLILGGALAFAWRRNSLPTVFMGFAGFLVLLYLLFIFSTIPQMDSEKWLHNYDIADAPSFEMQFISSLDQTLFLTHGIGAAFLLCDKTKEVRDNDTSPDCFIASPDCFGRNALRYFFVLVCLLSLRPHLIYTIFSHSSFYNNLQPSVTIPKAVVRLSTILCFWLPVMVVCVASQYPGVTLNSSTYWDSANQNFKNDSFEPGFAAAFHISRDQASLFCTFLPYLICAFCYMWASALQIQALAEAQLLFPGLLKQREGEADSPTRALVASIGFGFLVILARVIASILGVSLEIEVRTVLNMEIMSTLLVKLSVVVAYVYFRTWGHVAITETCKTSFSRAGAVCAALIFLFMLAAMPYRASVFPMTIRQEAVADAAAAAFIALYLALMSIYYFRVARAAQTMTDAESSAYLSIYAIKANRERDEKIRLAAKNRYQARSEYDPSDLLIASTLSGGSAKESGPFASSLPVAHSSSVDCSQRTRTTESIRLDKSDSFKVAVSSKKPSPRPATPDSSFKIAVGGLLI